MHTTKEGVGLSKSYQGSSKKRPERQRNNPEIFTKPRVWFINNYAAIKFSFPFMV
jgi:hypothetical protein